MNSPWLSEIGAIIRKEVLAEMRNRSAGMTALMLSIATVFTMAFAFYGRLLTGDGGAGLLWSALLFAGVGTLARAFVAEEELGTGDLLRMWARPHSVFWGKTVFSFLQMTATAIVVSVMFLTLTGLGVTHFWVFALSLLGGSAALAGTVTFSSALIARGSNRGTLAGVVALPLLVPLMALGVTAGRNSLGEVQNAARWDATAGIWMYAVLVLMIAPHLFAALWREP